MQTKNKVLIVGLAALAGGVAAGVFFAPQTGRKLRSQLVQSTQDSAHWVSGRLHTLENSLASLEEQLHSAGDQFADSLHEKTDKVLSYYLPDVPASWELEDREVARQLRRMPRR